MNFKIMTTIGVIIILLCSIGIVDTSDYMQPSEHVFVGDDIDYVKQNPVFGDNGNDSEAYFYWTAPPSSFGIKNMRFLNETFFQQKFQNHFYKDAMYKRYSYSDWQNGNQYVTVNKTWNSSGFWKIDIILDIPVDIYEVNISFGCDIPVLQYIDREGYEIWIVYQANNTENYTICFNWSDIANIPGLWITKHKEDGIFWISLHKNNVPAGYYVFDPTFGEYNVLADWHDLINNVCGFRVQAPASGYITSVTVYLGGVGAGEKIRATVYHEDDYINDTIEYDGGDLVSSNWNTLVFDEPYIPIISGDWYNISFVASHDIYVKIGSGSLSIWDDATVYGSAFPNPFDGVETANKNMSAYVTYVESGNNAPTQSGESPVNGSTGISLTPNLFVVCNDTDGDTMNATWWSNSSGSWVQFAVANTSISSDTNITQTNSNFSNYNTKYWWSVNLSDGMGGWNNETYSFTTLADTTPPNVTINFAGNLSDSGGPYYKPPYEDDANYTLYPTGGYYANDSRQSEEFIYVNVSANETNNIVTNVWFNLLNETIWTNWTYDFVSVGNNYWEFNSSGNITFAPGYNYSFNIVANSTGGSNNTWWNKTGIGGYNTRRWVQLNYSSLTDITYTPLFVWSKTEDYTDGEDDNSADRLHHDQGTADNPYDVAYIKTDTPDDTVQYIYCMSYIGGWFDSNICIEPFTLDTIYYHVWYSTDADHTQMDDLGWHKRRDAMSVTTTNSYTPTWANSESHIYCDDVSETPNTEYYLTAHNLDVTNTGFTDNDIYEFVMVGKSSMDRPCIINNASFTSFILFNVPSDIYDGTDNVTDTDNDGLSDHAELNYVWGSATNPFDSDTDNDGINDYWERQSGSDPNNYTETYNVSVWSNTAPTIEMENPVNGSTGIDLLPQLHIRVNDTDGNQSTVFWYTNDSGTWYEFQRNTSVLNTTIYEMIFVNASGYGTTYWWKVSANDTHDNTTKIYHFTTRNQYTPEIPGSFTATKVNRTKISISWSKGTNATNTYIRYAEGATAPANRATGTFLYNDTGTSTTLTGLNPGTQYSFSGWSWNSTDNAWSVSYATSSATTDYNLNVTIEGINPSNGSTNVDIDMATVNITINDPEGDKFSWTIQGHNLTYVSGNDETNGSKSANVNVSLPYETLHKWWVNVTDEYGNTTNEWYVFTTRTQYTPDAPTGFTATTNNRTKITLTWTDHANADTTRVEWNTVADGTWAVGDHTLLYNGSAQTTTHTGLTPGEDYFYKAWSWNETDSVWSSGTTDDNITDYNLNVTYSNENPSNNSIDQSVSLTFNVTIEDPEGDKFTWNITCSNGQTTDTSGATNGSKSLSISGLSYSTTYTIWVNTSDVFNNWTKQWYNFTTLATPTVWYVSTTGNDATGDGSIGNPYASLDKAQDECSDGHTIYMRGGTYTNVPLVGTTGFDIEHNGTTSSPYTISAYNNEEVILDFGGKEIDEWNGAFNIKTGDNNVTIDGIEIYNITDDNHPVYNSCPRGFYIDGTDLDNIKILNCTFNHIPYYAFLVYEDDTVNNGFIENFEVANCFFTDTQYLKSSGETVGFIGCRNIEYHNNTYRDYEKIGVVFSGGCSNVSCHDNDFQQNGTETGESIYVDTQSYNDKTCYDVDIYNNKIWGQPEDILTGGGMGSICIGGEQDGGYIHNISVYNNIINVSYDGISGTKFIHGIEIKHQPSTCIYDNISIIYNTVYIGLGIGKPIRIAPPVNQIINLNISNNILVTNETRGNYHQLLCNYLNPADNNWKLCNNTFNNTQNVTLGGNYPGTVYDGQMGVDYINASPQFVDYLNGDFSLSVASPCIDSANTTWVVSDDIIGTVRPQLSGYDIGAYESLSSNPSPTITFENPSDTSTGVSLQPVCNVTVNDPNGDSMNVSFASNYSSSWVIYQTNSTVGNGSYQWSFTNANNYNTKYWWRVYCNDGTTNVSETYSFTTIQNYTPIQSGQCIWNSTSGVNKTLSATGVSLYPTCFNVTVNDTEDTMTITLYTNESGDWTQVNTSAGLSNGTYSYTNTSWIDTYSTKYWITFNVTDGLTWSNETFNFTTGSAPFVNTPPTQNSHSINGGSTVKYLNATDVNMTATSIRAILSDTDGHTMNWTIYYNNSGTWDTVDNDTGVGNGTIITTNVSWFQQHTNHTISYNVTDGIDWTNETYWFYTDYYIPILSNPSPSNGSTITVRTCNWHITITDQVTFNWTIECNSHNSSGNNNITGTYYLNMTGLNDLTTYTVYVNATNGNRTVNESFIFTVMLPSTPTSTPGGGGFVPPPPDDTVGGTTTTPSVDDNTLFMTYGLLILLGFIFIIIIIKRRKK